MNPVIVVSICVWVANLVAGQEHADEQNPDEQYAGELKFSRVPTFKLAPLDIGDYLQAQASENVHELRDALVRLSAKIHDEKAEAPKSGSSSASESIEQQRILGRPKEYLEYLATVLLSFINLTDENEWCSASIWNEYHIAIDTIYGDDLSSFVANSEPAAYSKFGKFLLHYGKQALKSKCLKEALEKVPPKTDEEVQLDEMVASSSDEPARSDAQLLSRARELDLMRGEQFDGRRMLEAVKNPIYRYTAPKFADFDRLASLLSQSCLDVRAKFGQSAKIYNFARLLIPEEVAAAGSKYSPPSARFLKLNEYSRLCTPVLNKLYFVKQNLRRRTPSLPVKEKKWNKLMGKLVKRKKGPTL